MLESDKRDSEGLIPGAVGQNIVLERELPVESSTKQNMD